MGEGKGKGKKKNREIHEMNEGMGRKRWKKKGMKEEFEEQRVKRQGLKRRHKSSYVLRNEGKSEGGNQRKE